MELDRAPEDWKGRALRGVYAAAIVVWSFQVHGDSYRSDVSHLIFAWTPLCVLVVLLFRLRFTPVKATVLGVLCGAVGAVGLLVAAEKLFGGSGPRADDFVKLASVPWAGIVAHLVLPAGTAVAKKQKLVVRE